MPPHSTHVDCEMQRESSSESLCDEPKRRSSVTFSDDIARETIPTRDQYSAIELASMYMSRFELDSVRRDARQTLEKIRSVKPTPEEDEDFCTLGLQSGVCTPSEFRKKSREAVLREQRSQSIQGSFCDELIAMSYTDFTVQPREAAYQQGIGNARDVLQAFEDR